MANKKTDVDNAGDSITTRNANWKFSGDIVKNFRNHVRKSVPLYNEGHDLVCRLSDFFVKHDSVVYEMGVSLGDLLLRLVRHNQSKTNVKWYGIDCEPDMIQEAQEKFSSYENVILEAEDVNTYDFQKSDMIISYYCIQFIHPKARQQLISKIYERLEWGGAFVWFEKVRGPDARFQDIMTSMYTDFKLEKGYSAEEIVTKTRSLKGILEPFSTEGNIMLLKRAGFVDILSIMKYVCFEGFLAIK
ncbi:MAG: methyltransferase [Parcubacteria group bacterium]|jgi:tRNA (cmo5U34)-methyltransferase|nr:methyltransferase [Parcubacteria group bacterium]